MTSNKHKLLQINFDVKNYFAHSFIFLKIEANDLIQLVLFIPECRH